MTETYNYKVVRQFAIMTVVWGIVGMLVGVIIAAVLLGVLSETLRSFGDYRMIIYSLLLIVLMLTRPQGLFIWPLWKKKST